MNRLTLVLTGFLMFTQANAQEASEDKSKSFSKWLTETPWIVNFGGDLISDNQEKLTDFTYYPAKFTA